MAVENIDFKINALIDAGKAATTLGELRTNLKQLSDLAAEVGPNNVEAFNKITTAAGQTRDRVKDIKESVTALAGTPMERLTNGFGRLRQAIFELDFDKFKQSLLQIKDGALALGTQLAAPFTNAGKALVGLVTGTESLTVAMRALGGAIAATGIGALVIAVGLLIANFDKLKTAGGLIGNTFGAINNVLEKTISYFEKILNQIGLIDTESAKRKKERENDVQGIVNVQKKAAELLKEQYEKEKKAREETRQQVFLSKKEENEAKERYRKEDLAAEAKYYKSLGFLATQRTDEALKSLENRIRQEAKQYGVKVEFGEGIITTKTIPVPEPNFEGMTQDERYQAITDYEKQLINASKNYDEFLVRVKEYAKIYRETALNDAKVQKVNSEIAQQSVQGLAKVKAQYNDLERQNTLDRIELLKQETAEMEKQKKLRSSILGEDSKMTGLVAGRMPTAKLNEQQIKKQTDDELDLIMKGIKAKSDAEVEADRISLENAEKASQSRIDRAVSSEQEKLYYQQQIAFQGVSLANQVNDLIYQSDYQRTTAQLELERNSAAFKAEARKKGLTEEQLYQQKLVETQNEVNRKQFNRNKALQIASAVVNTASAIAQINAQPLVNADISQTLRTTLTALVGAVGAAQIATIASAKYQPDAIPNTPVTPTSGITATETVTPAQFTVGEFKKGQFVDQRVYVVESDVTGIQRKVRVIENRSKF